MSSPLRIPFAADGTSFDPATCRRGGGYWIGPKGSERKFAKYEYALAALNLMANPCWRRPNTRRHWGIVSAVGWM